MIKPHAHVCGFILPNGPGEAYEPEERALLDVDGCGHAWVHEDLPSELHMTYTEDTFHREQVDRHTCPNCGKGPYKWRVNERTWLAYREHVQKQRSLNNVSPETPYPPAYNTVAEFARHYGSV